MIGPVQGGAGQRPRCERVLAVFEDRQGGFSVEVYKEHQGESRE